MRCEILPRSKGFAFISQGQQEGHEIVPPVPNGTCPNDFGRAGIPSPGGIPLEGRN